MSDSLVFRVFASNFINCTELLDSPAKRLFLGGSDRKLPTNLAVQVISQLFDLDITDSCLTRKFRAPFRHFVIQVKHRRARRASIALAP